jgi:tryptophan synthase alpha chain
VEEAEPLRPSLVAAGLDPIFLISPTTIDERIERSAALGAGFLYVISRLGVTGARDELSAGAGALVERVKRHSSLPVALGFGISRPEQVAAACRHADAAVVGSAIVNLIAGQERKDVAGAVRDYVGWLKSSL